VPLLPRVRTIEERRASPRGEATDQPAVAAICREHGLRGAPRKYAGGSTIVFAIGGEHVVKLFEPIFADNAATEERVLRHVDGRLGIPTPGVVVSGEIEEWRYVVMRQLRGRLASDAWADLSVDARRSVCEQVGRATARLHALAADAPGLPGPEWRSFLAGQHMTCVDRQRSKGLHAHWISQIPAFLASVDLSAAGDALLHTEIMREHVLIDRDDADFEVTGIFDFEPAMLGAAEYDLASVGVFLTGGDPALFDAFLSAYGSDRARRDAEMPRRVLAYALLHRYSNLRWYLETVPPRGATTFGELALEWYGWE
jgi:hygromycin-B 7''-O-kinase